MIRVLAGALLWLESARAAWGWGWCSTPDESYLDIDFKADYSRVIGEWKLLDFDSTWGWSNIFRSCQTMEYQTHDDFNFEEMHLLQKYDGYFGKGTSKNQIYTDSLN